MGSLETKDSLRQMGDKVSDYCKKQNLHVFNGYVVGSEGRHVCWNAQDGSSWTSFLEIAKSLDVKLIYLNLIPFEDSQVVAALETDEEDNTQIESYRSKVGLIACIELAFLYDGVFHIFELKSDWFMQFQELVADTEKFEEEEDEIDQEVVDEWAKKLANDPRYNTCKNKTQRSYLLEQLAGKKYEELPDWEILDLADKIYFFEVKAKEDQRLKIEALRLRDEGKNLNAIAQKLGISRDRVSGLLKS